MGAVSCAFDPEWVSITGCMHGILWCTCLPVPVEEEKRLEAADPLLEGDAACPSRPDHPNARAVRCAIWRVSALTNHTSLSHTPRPLALSLTDQRRLSHVRRNLQRLQRPHRRTHQQQRPQGAAAAASRIGF